VTALAYFSIEKNVSLMSVRLFRKNYPDSYRLQQTYLTGSFPPCQSEFSEADLGIAKKIGVWYI
jgi:hypothetical protein